MTNIAFIGYRDWSINILRKLERKTKKVKFTAKPSILRKIKKLSDNPVVAIGGINEKNYKKLLLNKANFLAISSYIWNNNKYKPYEAIEKLK